jgi:hypothetical protein
MRSVSPAGTVTPAPVNRYLLPQERPAITVRMHPAALTGHLVMAGAGLLAAMKLASRSARPETAWGAYLLSRCTACTGGRPGRQRTSS